ncbi:MAG: hypothetical protein HYX51_11945 [Chloroflexi bacterium]|nr:hypothetical protein [Chloroflexota bacterium]
MASNSDLVQQGRAAIDTVAQRVQSGPGFAARFKEEPVAVLIEAGAPAEGLGDILRETGFGDQDVSGYFSGLAIDPSRNLGIGGPGLAGKQLAGGSALGRLPGGGLQECSGTCNCSSSCLLTF